MHKVLIFFVCFTFHLSFAQEQVELISTHQTLEKSKDNYFGYLFPETNLAEATLIAKVKGKGKKNQLVSVMRQIKNMMTESGANAFLIEQYQSTDSKTFEIVIAAYYCSDDLFEENYTHVPKNKVYVFGNDDLTNQRSINYKINGEKKEVYSLKYQKYEVKIGEELKINKGGFTGMTFWISGKENKGSTFLTFTGLGFGGANYNPANGGVGVSINTGRIDPIDPNLGLVLLKVFEEQE